MPETGPLTTMCHGQSVNARFGFISPDDGGVEWKAEVKRNLCMSWRVSRARRVRARTRGHKRVLVIDT